MFPIDLLGIDTNALSTKLEKTLDTFLTNDVVLDQALIWLKQKIESIQADEENERVKKSINAASMQLFRHMDHWSNITEGRTPGYYNPNVVVPHPMQDPAFPFIYDPGMDAYIGFRWDYGDQAPITRELTPEVLQILDGLFLSNDIYSYYCPHGNVWQRRLTVIFFRVNNYFRAPASALPSWNFTSKNLPMTKAHEKEGYVFHNYSANDMIVDNFDPNFVPDKSIPSAYVEYRLHPDYNNLKAAGYDSLFIPASPQTPTEFFLFDPKVQVVQTMWFQVNV